MRVSMREIFGSLGHILALCPSRECGEIFRLSDARPFLKEKRARSILDDLDREERRIDDAIEQLEEREAVLREKAKLAGLKEAKQKLMEIDPIFSGSKLDPQDVKVIFDPIEYVVFDGMSNRNVERVLFLAHEPQTSAAEKIHKSIATSLKKGNLSFKTLRILDDGGLELK